MLRRRFRSDRQGGVAVEFALLALPFFTILFGLIELAVVYFIETAVQDALSREVRRIRTGQLQIADPPVSKADFTQSVCARVQSVVVGADCARLYVDVRAFSNYGASRGIAAPFAANGEFDPSLLVFQPGGAEQTILARAYYEYDVSSPLTRNLIANSSSVRLITATELFRSEPFS